MDFISTPTRTFAPGATNIIQTVTVSMDKRTVAPPVVHLVQYDQTLPIVAVKGTYQGLPYTFPANAAINIRLGKPDGKHVYVGTAGISGDRQTVYVAITPQMTAAFGRARGVIEIVLSGGIAGSAAIDFDIDRNPVSMEAYESSDEFKAIVEYVEQAEKAAADAKASKDAAASSATSASQSQSAAKKDADRAEAARKSIEVDYEALDKAVKDASSSAAAATESANNSKSSADHAEECSKLSESWAVGGTGERVGEDTNNSKYWANMSQGYAEQASVPPVQGVYNIILTDRATDDKYALIVESGHLALLGVPNELDATNMTLIDRINGLSYGLVIESGRLFIEEAI